MTIASEGVTRLGNRTRLTDCFNQYSHHNRNKKNRIYVEDQQLWEVGTMRINAMFTGFSGEIRQELTELLTRYRNTKESMAAVIDGIGAASVCRECGGQCCLNGKYRINVFDALACIALQIRISANFSLKPVCPYSSDTGCTMNPGLRPADCVSFICDAIEQKLSPRSRLILAGQESALRECIQKGSCLIAEPVGTPLLLWTANIEKIK